MGRPTALTPDQVARLVRAYKAGALTRHLAERFGVSGDTVRKTLIENGVEIEMTRREYSVGVGSGGRARNVPSRLSR